MSKNFGIKYKPVIGSSSDAQVDGNVFLRINLRGIMMSAMPGFISMALVLAISKIPGMEVFGDVFQIMIKALPVILATIAAKQVSGLDEVGIISGIIASVLSIDGGVIGGIVGAYLLVFLLLLL